MTMTKRNQGQDRDMFHGFVPERKARKRKRPFDKDIESDLAIRRPSTIKSHSGFVRLCRTEVELTS